MAMLSGNRTFVNCRLCLTEIHDSNVTLLDGIIKDMMEIILPELNLSICETPSVCKSCLETLKQSYSFKSSCLEVEDKVQDFVMPETTSLVDLKEVLKQANDIKQISENLVVCRTCLGLGEESLHAKLCSYEGDPLQNMVEKCLPEMGLNLTKDPSICPMCLEQLEEQFHFIMQCLDTEAKINYYSERRHVFKHVDLHNVYLFSMCMEETDELDKHYETDESLMNGNCDRGPVVKLEETPVKSHCEQQALQQHIKTEEPGVDCIDLTEHAFSGHIKNKVETDDFEHSTRKNMELFNNPSQHPEAPKEEVTFELSKDGDGEDIITSHTSKISQENSDSDSDISVTKESDLLAVKKVTSSRIGLRKIAQSNILLPSKTKQKLKYTDNDDDDKSEEEFNKKRRRTRKCKLCNFKTKFGSRMKAHMTVNHSLKQEEQPKPEKKLFKCRRCPFTTPNQPEYKNHKHDHQKEKEQKCPKCSMVFIRTDFLKKHIESHGTSKTTNKTPSSKTPEKSHLSKPPTSINMSKLKNSRNMFSINGKVLKMFKCRICPYQTRLKSNYEKHAQTHKKTSEIVTHRCKICNFETIQKENYLSHMQSHENEGENKLMRCFLCSFQPATELALKQHISQVHKSGTG